MTVFKMGTLKVSKTSTLTGGQFILTCTSLQRLLLKNDQKNLEKNIISEKINKIILDLNLLDTSIVCKPIYVDSRHTSRHHLCNVVTISNILGKIIIINEYEV